VPDCANNSATIRIICEEAIISNRAIACQGGLSMSTIDSMRQNPGEWFPVSLDEVCSTKLDFERRGIPVDPEWSELLLTAAETGPHDTGELARWASVRAHDLA
jgi:hypothetical protein